VNNNITDFAQVVPVYAAAVDAGFGGMAGGGGGGGHKICVGARIAHNRIKGTPHGPVIRGSFDKVFEYNWIEEFTTVSGDFGGIYNYQSTNGGGYDILRYNYMFAPTNYVYPTYLNPGPTGGIGIQVDSTWAGDEMYGNIATCRRSGFGAGGGGGAGAKFYNNFTVNCGAGGTSWSGLPSVYATNFGALGSTAISGDVTGPNFTYATDPGFINWQKRDLRLEPTSTVYSDLPGFREVPFEMIGLYNDEYRTNATPPAPVIRNLTAASGITTNGATLNGELVFPWVTPDTTVRVFWGANNGGTNAVNWSNSIHLGLSTRAKFATNVTGLLPSQTYFYRFQASNHTHVVWASNTVSFVIPNPGYEATISFPGYTRAEVLTNIPMLVTLSTNIPDFSSARFTSPSGGDLRFKTMDGLTDLNFEIESWNTNGDSRVWVQVPALTPTASVIARWGDPVATNPPASSLDGSTWNNGYVGVYHLKSTTVTDSSPVPKNASANSGAATNGIVAGGVNYNGTSQSTTIPHHGDFNLAANFEIQGWFKLNAADKQDYRTLTSKEIDFNNRDWWIAVRTNGTLWWKSGALLDVSSAADLANGQWHHFAAVHDGVTARLYVDGAPVAADATPGSADTQNSSVYLGFENGSTRYHKGPLDEFRFSNVKRSSNWVWAVYQNIASNSSFVGFSAITNLLPTAPASLTASAANGQIVLNWTASSGSDSYVVKRAATNAGPYNMIASLAGLAFTNSGLVNGTTYYYIVAGLNSRGEGAPSPVASATPLVNSVKANNTVDLDLAGSWVNSTVPTGALAIWDATVTTNAAVTIGNGVSFAGLRISDPGTNIIINPGIGGIVELGSSGIDLALSSQRLTVNAPLGLTAAQIWKTGNHSTPGVSQIVVSNVISGPGSLILDNANTRSVLLATLNTFSGGFTLGGSATVKFAPLNATGAGGVVSSNVLGLGPLTIHGGVLANTAQFGLDQGIAHSSITVNGDFALNPPGGQNAGRIMIAGVWNLGGELRTVSTTRATTASGALTAGGFTSWGIGAVASVASTVSNGTLRVVRDPAAGGTYVSFRANNPSFAGNAGLTLGSNVICTVPNTWTPAVGSMAALTIEAGGYLNLGEAGNSRNVSINSLAGEGTVGNFNTSASVGTSTLTITGGSQLISTTFSGRLMNTDTNLNAGSSNGILALTKAGSSTQIIEGNSSYTGPTAVSGGVLILNGEQSAATGPVSVASGATLAGKGVIGGAVTISNGATLFTGAFPATLTLNSNLNLAGTTRLAIGRNGSVLTNDALAVANAVTYGGTLVISNLGATTLQPGDSFPLFPAASYSGSFANIFYPAGYTFSNSLATDGRITVLTSPPNTPPALVPLGDLFATAGQWLYVTNIATDVESPPQTLTFSLLSAQPGASIATNTGVFAWHIPIGSGGAIETITVSVADNGAPSFSDTQSLVVFIGAATTPQISAATLSNGVFNLLIAGDVGPDYTVQASTNLTAWDDLLTTNPTMMPMHWSDDGTTNFPRRFYRVRLSP
jgi:autotransporter-associated beta strand protein